jgi:hypothetical protein
MTFDVSACAIIGLPGQLIIQYSLSQSPTTLKNNQGTDNVITYNTCVADIPGIASGSGSDDLTVGNISHSMHIGNEFTINLSTY